MNDKLKQVAWFTKLDMMTVPPTLVVETLIADPCPACGKTPSVAVACDLWLCSCKSDMPDKEKVRPVRAFTCEYSLQNWQNLIDEAAEHKQ